MIYVNNKKVDIKHFPDGSQRLFEAGLDDVLNSRAGNYDVMFFNIEWVYESDEELVTIMYLLRHYREKIPVPYLDRTKFRLIMNYLPNARMDRTKEVCEVFTLKYFCEFINSLNFDEVVVLDPHSNVGVALLNNLIVKSSEIYIKKALDDIEGKDIDGGEKYAGTTVIYFPDEGAMKRYSDMSVFKDRTVVYGHKIREWKNGKIVGLKIRDRDGEEILRGGSNNSVNGKVVLMIDDIVSYGVTLAYSADSLRGLGATAIYGYVSHTENSILDKENGTLIKRIESGVVDELFTTDSLYTGKHPRITVIYEHDTDEEYD